MTSRISPHILFATEKWVDESTGRLSPLFHNLFGSFESTGFGRYTTFFYGEHRGRIDEELLRAVHEARPDLVMVDFVVKEGGYVDNPTSISLGPIKNSGIPLATVWWDGVNSANSRMCDAAEPFVTAQFIVDHNSFVRGPSFMALWSPQDPRVFNDPCLPRNLDVTFVGSMNADRWRYLQYLSDSGIPIVYSAV